MYVCKKVGGIFNCTIKGGVYYVQEMNAEFIPLTAKAVYVFCVL